MKKIIILTQTLLFLSLYCLQASFNKSLGSFSQTGNLDETTINDFMQVAGKGIKELINQPNPYQIKTVVIDPGHGGRDPGCLGSSSKEKALVLAIGTRLKYMLNKEFPEIKVIMTRNKDVFIPLHKRAAIANRNNADLFISIHCNFMPGSAATRGSETFVMGLHKADENLRVAKRENASILLEEDYEKNYDYDPNSPEGHIMLTMFQSAHLEQSILFAELAEEKMKLKAGRRSRGVKQAGFVVLRQTTMPSVLVEAGFLSNNNEQNFLKTEAGQMKMAGALLEAFKEYKNTVESSEYLQFSRPAKELASLPKSNTSLEVASENRKLKKEKTGKPIQVANKPVKGKQDNRAYSNVYKPSHSKPEQPNNFQFFVQLAASAKKQNTAKAPWINLGYPIEVVQEKGLFKYRARNFAHLDAANKAKADLQKKGFPDAFIVVLKNGVRVSLKEALKN